MSNDKHVQTYERQQTTLNVQTSQRQQMSKHMNDNIQTTLNVQNVNDKHPNNTCRQHANNIKCPNMSTNDNMSKQHIHTTLNV